jgi:hypothetical protein
MDALQLHNLAQTYRRRAAVTQSDTAFELFCSMARRLDKLADVKGSVERHLRFANDAGVKVTPSTLPSSHFTTVPNLFQDRQDLKSHE